MNAVVYSKERMDKAITGIEHIHSGLIEHNDSTPRTFLVVSGFSERVGMGVKIDLRQDLFVLPAIFCGRCRFPAGPHFQDTYRSPGQRFGEELSAPPAWKKAMSGR